MYNRYIPTEDGQYLRKRVEEVSSPAIQEAKPSSSVTPKCSGSDKLETEELLLIVILLLLLLDDQDEDMVILIAALAFLLL